VKGRLATVITNLLSAIPWIGQDFVEFVWTIYLFLLIPFPTVAVLLILLLRVVDPLLTIRFPPPTFGEEEKSSYLLDLSLPPRTNKINLNARKLLKKSVQNV
jgi:hypothetical protein